MDNQKSTAVPSPSHASPIYPRRIPFTREEIITIINTMHLNYGDPLAAPIRKKLLQYCPDVAPDLA